MAAEGRLGVFKGVSISDWVSLAVGVLGVVSALLQRRNRLPDSLVKWRKRLTSAKIEAVIAQAAALERMRPRERRAWAVEELKELAMSKCGIRLPTSVANALVEVAYQGWKKVSK